MLSIKDLVILSLGLRTDMRIQVFQAIFDFLEQYFGFIHSSGTTEKQLTIRVIKSGLNGIKFQLKVYNTNLNRIKS